MRTKYLFGAMATLMMTACSQDEMVSVRQDGIAYSVSANTQSRAADSYCRNLLPDYFKVWAKSDDGLLYINGDKIENKAGVWTDENGTRYWPEDNKLDFYAEVNGDEEFSFNDGAPTFNDFTVKNKVTEQVDLMYSVRKGQSKSVDKVMLNFRHALSQVCFKAKNSTKNMRVVIKGVSVGHLTNKGTFLFPKDDTSYNYENHTDNNSGKVELNGGQWVIPYNAQYDNRYDVTPLGGTVTLAPGKDANLTCPEDNHKKGFEQVLTLLPQDVDAWDPNNAGKTYDGAYFLLNLVLSNITKDNAGNDVFTTVYTGKAAIPVSVAWEQGYRYIYTFVFDEGGDGGWTPYPDPYDPDYPDVPQPVLTTIKYDVTVDDFVPVDGDGKDDTNMNTGTSGTYKYSTTLKLHSNYGETEEVKTVQLNSNTTPYSYTLASDDTPSRDDADFLGWATSSTATVAKYKEGESVSVNMEKEILDLYAVWQEKNTEFKLVFNGVRDEAVNVPGELTYSGLEDSHEFIVPGAGSMTCGNYEFKGWADTDKVETVADIVYQAGDKITLTKDSPIKTIYAVWAIPSGAIAPPPASGEDW